MKLIRTHPVSGLARVSDFDDWFQNPFAGYPLNLFRSIGWDKLFGGGETAMLAADVHEDQENYYARFEMPGVKKEDVKIELKQNLLTVTAERKVKSGDEESSFSLARSISVPDTVKADSIGAKLEDGILTVTLPKAEEQKPKNIQVS